MFNLEKVTHLFAGALFFSIDHVYPMVIGQTASPNAIYNRMSAPNLSKKHYGYGLKAFMNIALSVYSN